MKLIDVTSWKLDDKKQVSGTRAKHWIIHPDTQHRYLFKIPKENTGEAWAEKIASEIGKVMKYSIMDTEVAKLGNTIGVVAKNFIEKQQELFEGGDLFFSVIEDYDRYDLKHYDINNIIKVLAEFELDSNFIKIPIFDAFIGNQDRHCDNWGIIVSNNNYSIAPIYDSGSSLGSLLSEERIKLMFQDANMFNAFTNRSISLIGIENKKKPRHLDLLRVINQLYPSEVTDAMNRISNIDEITIDKIVATVPNEAMGDTHREWVKRLLLFRKDWLLKWYLGGV